jgi:glycosyltransferase A (GT-A) superfamily protein (DUF2064 family)
MTGAIRRAVLLFAKSRAAESRKKRTKEPRSLFELSTERIARAVLSLGDTDLVLVGAEQRPVLAPHARMLRQRGRSFGDRILAAFEDVRALGYSEVVAVPDEPPALDGVVLRNAFLALGKLEFVFGPSADGDVYLIGARQPVDHIFEGVRWRSQHVCADLLARARDAALLSPLTAFDLTQQN